MSDETKIVVDKKEYEEFLLWKRNKEISVKPESVVNNTDPYKKQSIMIKAQKTKGNNLATPGEVIINTDGFYMSSDNLIDSPIKLESGVDYKIIVHKLN